MGNSGSKSICSDPNLFASLSDNLPQDEYAQYDYVIVGGGTAGCVLASRLTEDPSVSVLLIEAGKSRERDFITRVPLAFTKAFKSPIDWNYHTTPQEHMGGKQVYWPRGKILGGTSAINALIYHRCAPEDFDEWERLGATGWAYKDILPYFDKAEKYIPSPQHPNVKLEERGRGGPWPIRHSTKTAPVIEYIIETCKAMGVPHNDDLNSPRGTLGVGSFTGFIDDQGQRSSSASAYLTKDVLSRQNLTIAVDIVVEKIVITREQDNRLRASGVELSTSSPSPRYRVNAKRSVVLCAGAVATPQLLLLSGIGPADDLRGVGIETVKDLPAVGDHLADHISCGPLSFRAKPGYTWDHYSQPLHGAIALLTWLVGGRGPLAALGTSSGAFLRANDPSFAQYFKSMSGGPVNDATSGPGAPDLELIWAPIVFMDHGFVQPPPGTMGVTMGAVSLRPESTGKITLKSNSIWDKPLINANYFSSESDMNVVLRGTRFLLRMARTQPLASILDLRTKPDKTEAFFWPGDADPDLVTDEELRQWIYKNGAPSFHPVSTARMGSDPASSVVDPQLRVHGVEGLHIVDASVFPKQVSGHPCAVVVAVAEKAADILKSLY